MEFDNGTVWDLSASTWNGSSFDLVVQGSAGADELISSIGNDTLYADAGIDSLYGGGTDTLRFTDIKSTEVLLARGDYSRGYDDSYAYW